jgi:hypothetical protein
MSDIHYYKNGEKTYRISPPSTITLVGTQCPKTKLEVKKMTEIDPSLITKDGDDIYFRGEKYKKVEEPKSFYNKLWELVSDKVGDNTDTDELTDRIMDLIRDNIPDPSNRMFMDEHLNNGYKATVKLLQEKFK